MLTLAVEQIRWMDSTRNQQIEDTRKQDGGYKKTRWTIQEFNMEDTRKQDGGQLQKIKTEDIKRKMDDARKKMEYKSKQDGGQKKSRWRIEEIKMEDTSKQDKGNKTESHN